MIWHNLRSIFLLAAGLLLCSASVHATNFSVLLSGNGSGGDDEPIRVTNPTYEEGSGGNVNPLYEPSALIFTPSQLTNGNDVLLTVNFSDSISGPYPTTPGGAFPFEITLQDAATGDYITQFATPFELCYEAPRLAAHWQQNPSESENFMLSFLDETKNPPVWLDDREVCGNGEVDPEACTLTVSICHLTIFALGPAPVPEPSASWICLMAFSSTLWRCR